MEYTNDDEIPTPPLYGGYAPTYSCVKPWIIKVPIDYAAGKYSDAHCTGKPNLDFSASFIPSAGNAYKSHGSVLFQWPSCSGGIVFNTTVLDHLTVFPDNSALWTGKISYNKVPGTLFTFSFYAVDNGKYGDAIHFRVTDPAGTVIFDTDPCMPDVYTNYGDQPTALPVNYVSPDSSVSVYTPTAEQTSALLNEDPSTASTGAVAPTPQPTPAAINVGLIVGIVIGIMVFVIVIAIIVFFLLKKQQETKAASTTTTNPSFMSM